MQKLGHFSTLPGRVFRMEQVLMVDCWSVKLNATHILTRRHDQFTGAELWQTPDENFNGNPDRTVLITAEIVNAVQHLL